MNPDLNEKPIGSGSVADTEEPTGTGTGAELMNASSGGNEGNPNVIPANEVNPNVATTQIPADHLGYSLPCNSAPFTFEAPNSTTFPIRQFVDLPIFGPEVPDIVFEGFLHSTLQIPQADWGTYAWALRDAGSFASQAALQEEIATMLYLRKTIHIFEKVNEMFLIQVREQQGVIKKLIDDFKPNDEAFLLDFNNSRNELKSSNLGMSIEVHRLKNAVDELNRAAQAPSCSAPQGNSGLKSIQFYAAICVDLSERLMRLSDEMSNFEELLDGNNLDSLTAYSRVLLKIYELPNMSVYELSKADELITAYMERQ